MLEKNFFWKPERWRAPVLGAEYKYSYEESQIVFDTMWGDVIRGLSRSKPRIPTVWHFESETREF